tara:strand:- start:536 stop:874 length:339 start_codon:yes stop_codon:yes gene_type:complete
MSVKERIQAVFLLQKFVRMSRFLLPAYVDLLQRVELTTKEQSKLSRIKKVYSAFKANPEMSRSLINSDILDIIKSLFALSRIDKDVKTSDIYKEFIEESDVLIQQWNKQIMN